MNTDQAQAIAQEQTIVIKRRIIIRKPTKKVKLVVVAEECNPRPTLPADLLADIITAGQASMGRCRGGVLGYRYVIDLTQCNIKINPVVLVKRDGKLVKAKVAVFFGNATRRADDLYRNKYFDMFALKRGTFKRSEEGADLATNAGLKKITYNGSHHGYYQALTLNSLREHLVANGCNRSHARDMNYIERVKWLLTADYDDVEGDVWKECVRLYGADKNATKSKGKQAKRDSDDEEDEEEEEKPKSGNRGKRDATASSVASKKNPAIKAKLNGNAKKIEAEQALVREEALKRALAGYMQRQSSL